MIVITPAFVEDVAPGRYNTPVRYSLLSWNTSDDAAADLVLLETVDTITSKATSAPLSVGAAAVTVVMSTSGNRPAHGYDDGFVDQCCIDCK